MSAKRIILPIIVLNLWILPAEAYAQSKNSSLVVSDSSSVKAKSPLHALFAGGGYGSNMIYLGSTMTRDHPYGYLNLTYGFKNKLYASFSTVHLSGFDPFLAFHIGSLSYNHVFNSWLDLSAGVYRYQVPGSLSDTLFSSFTYTDLTLGFDWKILYSKMSVGGLLSEENQVYFQLRNSRYFETPEFLNGRATISFDPYVNILFGSIVNVETSDEQSVIVSSPGRKWRKFASQSPGQITTYKRVFGMIQVDLGLPVALNTEKMTIETEPGYIIPLQDDALYAGSSGFLLMLSVIFRIF